MRAPVIRIEEGDLQARVDGRLAPDRVKPVDDYLAAHPDLREQVAQYAEQREALRAAFGAQGGEPIPPRFRVAHLLAAPGIFDYEETPLGLEEMYCALFARTDGAP